MKTYTHEDKDGVAWRFENGRPITRIADEVMLEVFPLHDLPTETVFSCEALPLRKIYAEKFPILDADIFRLSKKNMPMFGLFEVNSNKICDCVFTCRCRGPIYYQVIHLSLTVDSYPARSMARSYIGILRKDLVYDNTEHEQDRIAWGHIPADEAKGSVFFITRDETKELEFRTSFHGFLPGSIKSRMKHLASVYPHLAIVAEVESWQKHTITCDPFLVGFDSQKMRLLAHFNCTPMEEYIRREFTQ